MKDIDSVLITWLLVVICAQDCIRNPYLIAKLIEVLFVINSNFQVLKNFTLYFFSNFTINERKRKFMFWFFFNLGSHGRLTQIDNVSSVFEPDARL